MEFESVCDRTLVGWYHDTSSGKKGCLIGYKNVIKFICKTILLI